MTNVLVLIAVVAGFLPTVVAAGSGEENFVRKTVAELFSPAVSGAGRSEAQGMLRVLNDRVDVDYVTEQAFTVHYDDLTTQQKAAAATSILAGSATMLAAALDGSERVEITGSEPTQDGVTVVNSILTAPVDGLRDGLPVRWTVSRDFGLLKLLDIEVDGRSAVLVQSVHVNQLFEISQGNLNAVLAGMSEFEQ